ncbi:hypothetical protein [Marinobacterium weihaiense]|uniref:Lipoprotein n=1 Tax=Marinobacterium weihaiense TaxID=2851016 RepID=A0ABS6M968_9GAMM|nr:hypothetical protein [Marinobacterium weihaiense]MBV0932829.1 hypothetical protein [Marinobacterium weihaiense]
MSWKWREWQEWFKHVPVTVLVLPLILAGCKVNDVRPGQGSGYMVRGTLSQEADGYRFAACDVHDGQAVHIGSAALEAAFAQHSLGEGWPVYVEAVARHDADTGLALVEPLVVGGSLGSCDHVLADIELRAVADDGSVVFDLREDRIRVQYRDRLLQLGFKRPEVERMGGERRWRQSMSSGSRRGGHELTFELRKSPCTDDGGTWYALSMSAELNDRFYRGCARLGDLEHWPLRRQYVTDDSVTTRRLSLVLERNGRFRLTEDYLNDQPVLEREGEWRRLTGDRVRFEPEGEDIPPLSFRLAPDGRLSLSRFHPAYGRALDLQPVGPVLRLSSGELDWWR